MAENNIIAGMKTAQEAGNAGQSVDKSVEAPEQECILSKDAKDLIRIESALSKTDFWNRYKILLYPRTFGGKKRKGSVILMMER